MILINSHLKQCFNWEVIWEHFGIYRKLLVVNDFHSTFIELLNDPHKHTLIIL